MVRLNHLVLRQSTFPPPWSTDKKSYPQCRAPIVGKKRNNLMVEFLTTSFKGMSHTSCKLSFRPKFPATFRRLFLLGFATEKVRVVFFCARMVRWRRMRLHVATKPPSMGSAEPVIMSALSLSRYRTGCTTSFSSATPKVTASNDSERALLASTPLEGSWQFEMLHNFGQFVKGNGASAQRVKHAF